jgi:hypothetical protein
MMTTCACSCCPSKLSKQTPAITYLQLNFARGLARVWVEPHQRNLMKWQWQVYFHPKSTAKAKALLDQSQLLE